MLRPAMPARFRFALAVLSLWAMGAADVGAAGPAAEPSATTTRPRTIILGFDGVDPDLVNEYIAQGQLPHLQQLARTGTYSPLGTTIPAESPVSWSTFATGQNPGVHGIFDFLHRKSGTYYPEIA